MGEKKLNKKAGLIAGPLSVIGVNISQNGRLHAHLMPRFFVIIACLIGCFIFSMIGFAKYSTSPSFCKSCHIMKPYYTAWENSSHSHVDCVDCHYPPGKSKTVLWKKFQAMSQVAKYVTRTYSSKPFAEIEDASCLRSGCHSTRLLEGKVISGKGIKFNHEDHIMNEKKGQNLKCSTCHSQIVVGKHIEVTYDSCYLCHFKGRGTGMQLQPIGGCLGCHELPDKTFKLGNIDYNHRNFVTNQGVTCDNCHLDVVRGNGTATQERCFNCHNEPDKLKQYNNVAFLHDNHVTEHNVACFHCHQEIRHGFDVDNGNATLAVMFGVKDKKQPGDVINMDDFAHSGKTVVQECGNCHIDKHSGALAMYSGALQHLDLPEMPSPMHTANVECVGCHYRDAADSEIDEFKGATINASDKACVKCHGPKYKGIWKKTKAALERNLALLDEKITLVKAALNTCSMPEPVMSKMKKNFAKVIRRHNFLKTAKGEHNIFLASWIIREEDKLLSGIEDSLKTKFSDLSKLPLVSGRYCSTLCHFKLGVKSPPPTIKIFGKQMSHIGHAVMRNCVDCHVIGSHKDIALQKNLGQNVCADCHDPEKEPFNFNSATACADKAKAVKVGNM